MPEAVVDLLEVIAINMMAPIVMAASLGVAAFDGVEVVAVEGAGQCIVTGQVIQPAVEAAGSQARSVATTRQSKVRSAVAGATAASAAGAAARCGGSG